MLEIFTLTADNIKELAVKTGRSERDLGLLLEDGYAQKKIVQIYTDKPDIPEGYGRTN